MSSTAPPPLELPGTGVSWLERQLLGAGIRAAARFYGKDRLTQLFRQEAERAIALARGLSEAQGRQRVRVERFIGIEDSSRDWSVYMTLEHLVIVNTAIAAILPQLYSGSLVGTQVKIEEVKPVPEAGPEQIDDLVALVERYSHIVEKLGNLRAGARLPHPWFGALSAAQWHALAAIHNSTHRRQIERIKQALG
ncbi:MAG: DinB family protein [Lamprobacter sp.]|uniref:DinB family protein n=1 Tax=Lamprobacter sp. TaxID=3100796 RepID=UPI002B261BD3|nr:DinB family protein [Lamprobacter sp.]MEA3641402.1 DinB family protein [Lamprobacter sp.]